MKKRGESGKTASDAIARGCLEEDVFVSMTRSQATLARRPAQLFRRHRLSPVTYNILRILHGSGEGGLPCSEISKRLLTRVPDVTRLVDRLVKLGLVRRYRTERDRRLVLQTLTKKGAELLAQLDGPLRAIHRGQLVHLTSEQLTELKRLLDKCRKPPRRRA